MTGHALPTWILAAAVSGAAVPAAGPAPAAAPAHRQVAQARGDSASSQCAAGLPADSRMIYDASVRNMKSFATLRDTVVAETRSLVEAGRLNEAEARPAAERAGTCLRLLANP